MARDKAGPLPTPDDNMDRRRAFGRAFEDTIRAKGLTQAAAGQLLGMTQSAVSEWINAKNEPRYETVFAVERTLGVRPGALSRHLGYLPTDAVRVVADVETAITEDARLSDAARDALLGTLRAVRGVPSRKGRPKTAR